MRDERFKEIRNKLVLITGHLALLEKKELLTKFPGVKRVKKSGDSRELLKALQ
jgi:hypothetical protein